MMIDLIPFYFDVIVAIKNGFFQIVDLKNKK